MLRTVPILALAAVAAAAVGVACGSAGGSAAGGGGQPGQVQVVAAENFWGSIATQIGGAHAHVTSVIASPDTDPHAYEPTPQDARTVAQAQYVIINGAGYDPWAQKLVDANPASGRTTLTIATLNGRKDGDNPHLWYSPSAVLRTAQQIAADLARTDPNDASYFQQQLSNFTGTALARYNDLRSAIKSKYHGVPVGATESIFVDLAADLGLDLTTPSEFMKAIAEGNDPTPQDKATFDAQVTQRQIRVLVFNKQNSTPDISSLVDRATAQKIPVVAITETLDPATATFQDWQAGQLADLQQALAKAAG
jgi:zinc/manganese transport system substrate-binding protein